MNGSNPCYSAKVFVYETGSPLSTYNFAEHFQNYISSLAIPETDKVSLVMHSQGGLIGTLWLKHITEKKLPILKQLDAFITLSTPFWGADMANIGRRFFYTLPPGVNNPISPFGRTELNEMSYGSETMRDISKNLPDLFTLNPHIRILSMGGIKRGASVITGEDDVVVPHSSMRPDHYKLEDQVSIFETPGMIKEEEFKRISFGALKLVPADHITLDQPGVADVPEVCITNLNCSHPSLKSILTFLKGEKVVIEENDSRKFRTTIIIHSPDKASFDRDDFSLILKSSGMKIPAVDRFVPYRHTATLEQGVAFTFAGTILNEKEKSLELTVRYKNKPIRHYHVPVDKTLTTTIDLNLPLLSK